MSQAKAPSLLKQLPQQTLSKQANLDDGYSNVQELEINALTELIELFQQIDLDSPVARLNETTINDNNGGRIEL